MSFIEPFLFFYLREKSILYLPLHYITLHEYFPHGKYLRGKCSPIKKYCSVLPAHLKTRNKEQSRILWIPCIETHILYSLFFLFSLSLGGLKLTGFFFLTKFILDFFQFLYPNHLSVLSFQVFLRNMQNKNTWELFCNSCKICKK